MEVVWVEEIFDEGIFILDEIIDLFGNVVVVLEEVVDSTVVVLNVDESKEIVGEIEEVTEDEVLL